MNQNRLKVGLFWHSHNSTNLGVGALTVSNMILAREAARQIRQEIEFVIVGPWDPSPSYIDGDDTRFRTIDRKFITSPSGLWRTVGDLDAVLDITGGDSFTDIYSPKRYLFQHITKSAAILRKVPLVFSPQTIGPFNHGWSAHLAKRVMRGAHSVIARDHASFVRAKAMAPDATIDESIDVAFVLPYERVQMPANGKLRVGLNISKMLWSSRKENERFRIGYDFRVLIRKTMEFLTSQDNVEIHLIPHVHTPHIEWENDCLAHEEIAREWPEAIVVPPFPSPSAAKSYIAAMDFFMGSRMHACIAAYSSGVPLVPMSYSLKFDGLFGTLDYKWLIPAHGTGTDAACEKICEAFSEREEMKKSIVAGAEKVARLQENYRAHLRDLFQDIIRRKEALVADQISDHPLRNGTAG